MKRTIFYVLSCLIVAYLFFSHQEVKPPLFAQKQITSFSEIPIFIKNNLPSSKDVPSVHSPTLALMPDGKMLAMWFAGSGEGKPDVEIYGSFYDPISNLWSEPKSYLTRQKLKEDSRHFIKKLGNPVLYRAQNGDLHLFVTGVSFGGWATSKVYHYISRDQAQSFIYAGVLRLGAFMNLSHLVRSSPIGLVDGGFYLPVYHELMDKYPLIVRFSQEGEVVSVQKMASKKGQLQPSIVSLDEGECLAVFRNYYDEAMNMQFCKSGGLVWEDPKESNLINESSSVAIFRLKDEVFLIHNTREKTPNESRGTLVLSKLNEGKWEKVAILDVAQGERENGASVEVSYPNVQTNQDFVDIVYTNNRTHISHIRLNYKWIKDKMEDRK